MADNKIKTELTVDGSQAIGETNKVTKSFQNLEKNLTNVAKVSGVMFAALSGVIGSTVAAFKVQEKAERGLQATLDATGKSASITVKEMGALASALQDVTNYGDEAIIGAQSLLLSFSKVGKEVMPEATAATLDLAAKLKIDLSSAAKLVGKALEDPTIGMRGLRQAGIVLTDQQEEIVAGLVKTNKTAEAQAFVLDVLSKAVGGAAASQVDGFTQMKNAIGDVFEEVGRNLSPALEDLAFKIKDVAKAIGGNKELIQLVAKVIAVGTAVAGTVFAFSTMALLIPKVIAGLKLMAAVATFLGGTIKAALITSGIGALIVALAALLYYWKETWSAMQAVFTASVQNITQIMNGLSNIIVGSFVAIFSKVGELANSFGTLLAGVFTLDPDKIKAGLTEIGDAVSNVFNLDTTQLDQGLAQVSGSLKSFKDTTVAEFDKNLAELTLGTPEEITESAEVAIEALNAVKQAKTAQQLADEEAEFFQKEAHEKALKDIELSRFRDVTQAKRSNELDKRKIAVENNNLMLKDEAKYGEEFAKLNAVLRDENFKGAQGASGQLMALQKSSSSEMQAVGKAAAIVNASMATYEGAIKAYSSLAGIPIVGPGLGIAAAAALTAFGLEQVRNIAGMAQGGMVEGGIPNIDSVPIMAQRGELVVPRQNFEEVVNAVRRDRGAEVGERQNMMEVIIGFKDDAFQIIEEKLVERRAIGVGAF